MDLAIIKDLIIILVSVILVICILQLRRLKKQLTLQTQKRLFPNLTIEIDEKDLDIYIKNDSFFLAQNIKFQDSNIVLDDLGFKVGITLKFEDIDIIKPQEKIKLKFKAFDKRQNFLPDLTDRIIPHLLNTPFKIKIYLSNIENVKFCTTLNKSQRKFLLESIELIAG